jgi:hypothetical protein
MRSIVDQVDSRELDEFQVLNHSMAGAVVFPGNRRPGTLTINCARGMNSRIAGRLDLTVEAIRRHYVGEPSALSKTLTNCGGFFEWFESFDGFVNHFLLQDLLKDDGDTVDPFTPFQDFGVTRAVPESVEAYLAYRDKAIAFLHAGNRRIDNWAKENLEANRSPATGMRH